LGDNYFVVDFSRVEFC